MKTRFTSNYICLIVFVGLLSCVDRDESSHYLVGNWKATWETDPSGYPGLSEVLDFTMEGNFLIEKDSITIDGYGYKGCIFSEDTIHHQLIWKVKNDSLLLYNDPETPGLVYKIVSSDKQSVKLQLEDIFVTLSK